MRIPDVQILFYAIDSTSSRHSLAARWLEDAINAPEALGLTRPTISQFLRLGTDPAYVGCMADVEAQRWIDEWLDAGVDVISDADVGWNLLSELAAVTALPLRDAMDSIQLAGIAISRGATLASFDSQFECFTGSGLRWQDLGAAPT